MQGVAKACSNAQLKGESNAERLSEHLREYQANLVDHRELCASIRLMVDRNASNASNAYHALDQEIRMVHEDIKRLDNLQQSLSNASRQVKWQSPRIACLLLISSDALQSEVAASGLKEKVDAVLQYQAKHATSLEEIIRMLFKDMQAMLKRIKFADTRLHTLESSCTDTNDALARSCHVFATALKIPSPMPCPS